MTRNDVTRTRAPMGARVRLRAGRFSILALAASCALLFLTSNQHGATDRAAGTRPDQPTWQSEIQTVAGTPSREAPRPSAPRRSPLSADTRPDDRSQPLSLAPPRYSEPSLSADVSPSDDGLADVSTQEP